MKQEQWVEVVYVDTRIMFIPEEAISEIEKEKDGHLIGHDKDGYQIKFTGRICTLPEIFSGVSENVG